MLAGDFDTFDMQRIEVLRGPQGTLYGANSLAGVLKFATNPPSTDRFETRVRAGVESVEDGDMGYSGTGMINVAVVQRLRGPGDRLLPRAAGFHRFDRYRRIGHAEDINDSESYGGRLSALYTPSDAFSLRLSAILQNISNHASGEVESDPDTLDTLYGRLTQSQFVPESRMSITASTMRCWTSTWDLPR